jgi:ubiquinone/menaquinone biosynthesis C-methylase UbiE
MKHSPGGKKILDRAVEASGLKRGDRILDVGCGDGSSLAYLYDSSEIRGTGIDSSEEMLAEARQSSADIDFLKGDADFLEFESHSFDAVMLQCVLSLVEMRVEALHEAYCVLSPGGKLIVMDVGGDDSESVNPKVLRGECRTLGFECIHFEDRSDDLADFVVENILAGKALPQLSEAKKKQYSYFLMIFEKQNS